MKNINKILNIKCFLRLICFYFIFSFGLLFGVEDNSQEIIFQRRGLWKENLDKRNYRDRGSENFRRDCSINLSDKSRRDILRQRRRIRRNDGS